VRLPDWKQAGTAALLLTGIAAFTVFVLRPGGFEGQIGWFFALLPGAFVVANVARFAKVLPSVSRAASSTILWGSIVFISFLWYFVLSYAFLKGVRVVQKQWR
jgi:hypothetical protein